VLELFESLVLNYKSITFSKSKLGCTKLVLNFLQIKRKSVIQFSNLLLKFRYVLHQHEFDCRNAKSVLEEEASARTLNEYNRHLRNIPGIHNRIVIEEFYPFDLLVKTIGNMVIILQSGASRREEFCCSFAQLPHTVAFSLPARTIYPPR
jgi:hypothetical protein